MRVMMLVPAPPRGLGLPCEIFNLSRAMSLRDCGFEVVVVAAAGLTPPKRYLSPRIRVKELLQNWLFEKRRPSLERYEGLTVFHPKWYWGPRRQFWWLEPSLFYLFAGRVVLRVVRDFRPDLLIASRANPFGAFGSFIKRHRFLRFFAVLEGSDVLVSPDRFRGWSRIRRRLNRSADKIICVSSEMLERAATKRKLRNLVVIRNGFDNRAFDCQNGKPKPKGRGIRIVSVGNHYPVKGHDLLLGAMRTLDEDYELTLIGTGPLSAEYRDYVERNGLAHRVRFLGQVRHEILGECLSEHDLFCMPSRSEGLPAAPLEAMASGLPVIAAEVGGLKDLIIEGFNGLFFQTESVEGLASAIRSAAGMVWDRSRISEWAKKNFGWDRWAKEIVAAFRSIEETEKPRELKAEGEWKSRSDC